MTDEEGTETTATTYTFTLEYGNAITNTAYQYPDAVANFAYTIEAPQLPATDDTITVDLNGFTVSSAAGVDVYRANTAVDAANTTDLELVQRFRLPPLALMAPRSLSVDFQLREAAISSEL